MFILVGGQTQCIEQIGPNGESGPANEEAL
jgi:hypothetical protein